MNGLERRVTRIERACEPVISTGELAINILIEINDGDEARRAAASAWLAANAHRVSDPALERYFRELEARSAASGERA